MFADGAVAAARFMVGKSAGLYNMEDFLGAE
jgi:dihydrodipicolinate reductase